MIDVARNTRLHKSSRGVIHAVEVYGIWFDVEYDPELDTRGIVVYVPKPTIKLREWDSEVFLHECIHVALAVSPPLDVMAAWDHSRELEPTDQCWWRYQGRMTDKEQEGFVRHLSHLLDDLGFRIAVGAEVPA